jgi:hypothetical protein
MQLSELIGNKILVQTALGQLEEHRIGGSAATAELTGVEPGGIWIDHPGLAKDLSTYSNISGVMQPQEGITLHLFLPFSSILFLAYRGPDVGALERGLGENHEPPA